MKTGVILLAAGLSRRMGGPNKLLQHFRGEPLLWPALRAISAFAASDRVMMTGRDAELIRQAAKGFPVRCVHNEDFAQGLGSSIARGARALETNVEAIFIALADMPGIRAEDFTDLVRFLTPGSIAVPSYKGSQGHPVLFSGVYRAELETLAGDEGARRVLRAHTDRVTVFETSNPGVLRDLDTPGDFETAERDTLQFDPDPTPRAEK